MPLVVTPETSGDTALSIAMRASIERIANVGIKALLLNHLNVNAKKITELFNRLHSYDRMAHDGYSCYSKIGLPYAIALSMVFVYAPTAVCEEIAELLLACDIEERVNLLGERIYFDAGHKEHVLDVIMLKAPSTIRKKISTSIKTLSDDHKCDVFFSNRRWLICFTDFHVLLRSSAPDESVDLIEALGAIERNRLLSILNDGLGPLFKTSDGIIGIFEYLSTPPHSRIALAVLGLLENFNNIELRKFFFGSSGSLFTYGRKNLLHAALATNSELVVLKVFSLLKRLNEPDIKQLFTHRAMFSKPSGEYFHGRKQYVTDEDTPIEMIFRRPNNAAMTKLIIQQVSLYPDILPLIIKPLWTRWGASALDLATRAGNFNPLTAPPRVTLILENVTLDTSEKWWELGNAYYSGTAGKVRDINKTKECWEQAITLNLRDLKPLLALGDLYREDHHGVEKNLIKAQEYYEKAALLESDEAKKQLLIMENAQFTTPSEWCSLGNEYYNGSNGRTQDSIRARICYEQAIALDAQHTSALYMLGLIHKHGLAVSKNHLIAREFYQRAGLAGHELSKKQLLILDHPLVDNANKWNNLGDNYFFGKNGKTKDYLYAKWCYEIALGFDSTHGAAVESLKILSEHGRNNSPATIKTQGYYEEAMLSASHIKKQQLIIEDIVASDELARMEFTEGCCWLHLFARLPHAPLLNIQALLNAIRKVLLIGDNNPYARGTHGKTAFFNLTAMDPYGITTVLRPSDFIGTGERTTEVGCFFDGIKANPGLEQHLLLVSGPPGVGKTEITKAIARQQGFEVVEFVTGASEDKWTGQLEARIIRVFNEAARRNTPVCLFIDEIDAILPDSDDLSSDLRARNERIVTLFQTEIDKLKGKKIVLVGTTNYLERIKGAIKSRAGTAILFDLPDRVTRQLLIQDLLRFAVLEPHSTIIQKIVDATSGWSPRLLKNYIDTVKRKQHLQPTAPLPDALFEHCFEAVRKELERPKKGHPTMIAPKLTTHAPTSKAMPLSDMLLEANEHICAFIANSVAFIKINPKYKIHTLLYGPPGGGKTEFARLIVEKTNCPCFIVDPGNSIAELADAFSQAKSCEKAIIFIDEFDRFASSPAAAELIQTEMDGFDKPTNTLVVIAATNHLEKIVPPVLSRFGKKIEVLLPNEAQRSQFFTFALTDLKAKAPRAFDESLDSEMSGGCIRLGRETEHFSIRDMYEVLNQITPTLVKRSEGSDGGVVEPIMTILLHVISRVKTVVEIERRLPLAANPARFFSPPATGLAPSAPSIGTPAFN